MKRWISALMAACLLFAVLPVMASAQTMEELGWSAYKNDFTGWTVEDGKITCVYDQAISSWARTSVIEDKDNFVLELDISGDSKSSPYIKVLNVTIDVAGNNGNGNQIFLKIGDGANGLWVNAKGTKVHLKIARYNGGDLSVEVTGKGNEKTVLVYSAPIRSKDTTVEIGTYRGILVMENFTYRMPQEGEGPFEYPQMDPEQVNSKIIPLDIQEYFTFTGDGWDGNQSETWGRWLLSSATVAQARALYIREKLSGDWFVNTAVTPVSEENKGTYVAYLLLTNAKRADQLRLKTEHEGGKWQLTLQRKTTTDWEDLWQQPWKELQDGTLNLRLDRLNNTSVSIQILGDCGYSLSQTVQVPQEIMDDISYAGVATENSAVRFTGWRVGAAELDMDYAALAQQTYENLMKNFLDTDKMRLVPVRHGFPSETLTNTGRYSEVVVGAGEVWENTVLLMALDTYAQTLDTSSEQYREVASVIANTVSGFIETHGNNMRIAGVTPNYLMDDTGWTTMALLLGYHYHKQLGNMEKSAECFSYAKDLFNSAYDTFYDDAVGVGLIYSKVSLGVNGYGATLALSGWYMTQIDPEDQGLYGRVMDVYNGIETYLRRPDGMYWCDMGPNVAYTERDGYGIQEAGSCTYLGANMAMAVLNTLMGNYEKAQQTFLGIARYETYSNGAFMNDRDAWNNTFFLGMFVREVMGTGVVDDHASRALQATVALIVDHCIFEDGYYSACWSGNVEPDSKGWPSIGVYNVDYTVADRNRWGQGYNNGGLHVGSTPNQVMTSATTAHVLLAAALNEKTNRAGAQLVDLQMDGVSIWPVFDPDIHTYALQKNMEAPFELSWKASANAVVSVNGQVLQENTYTVRGGVVTITVTSADGQNTQTYTLDTGVELPVQEDVPVAMIVAIALVAVAAVLLVVALLPKKKG